MAIEHARAHALPKPWGVVDLRPWSNARHDGGAIGEIWYERPGEAAADPSLLLKLLFTNQPLSIQVHPDDAFAHSIGLPNGKTEAWYVLSAAPEAKVALGLNQRLTPQQLREAIDDGSISDLVVWRAVSPGDVFSFPPERSTRLARDLSLQRSSSAATRRFVFSIMAGSVNFTSKTQLRWRTPDRPIFASHQPGLPTRERFSSQMRTSCSNGSIWRQTPLGAWKRNERLGFSFSAAVPVSDRSTLPQATPFSRSRTASTCTPARIGMVGLVAYTASGPVPHLLQP